MKSFKFAASPSVLASALLIAAGFYAPAHAIELREAVQVAVDSNPQISQATQDKEAIEFERKQAQGLYLPRVTAEASAGAERLDSPTRRLLGLQHDTLGPAEVGLNAQYTLFDFGNRGAELQRQAARTDGAAKRVLERSEFVGLETVRQYINYLLQLQVVQAAQDNITFHEKLASDLGEGVRNGSTSIADQQQAQERLQAARARLTQAKEDLVASAISFTTQTGLPLDAATLPPPVVDKLPANLDDAIGAARTNNPRVKIAMSDVDAAHHYSNEIKSNALPRVSLEGGARYGNDVDGFSGRTTDLQARVVFRWTLYSGGVDQANYQEQVRRASEERYKLHEVVREIEDDVKTSWNRYQQQKQLLADLDQQNRISNDLLSSYGEQFKVGRRSLLDLLDAQNARQNSIILAETAKYASLFAQYRLLAAEGELLSTLGVNPPRSATTDALKVFNVPPLPPAELMERRHPD